MLDDLEFETLLHQKEVRAIQKDIVSALEQPNNADIIEAINQEIASIESLIEIIRNISPVVNVDAPIVNVEAPNVNVDVHQTEVTDAIKNAIGLVSEAQNKIIKLIGDLLTEAKRLKETEFSFTKDKDGEIMSPIIARQIK